jgi:hypothetical protein
MSRRKTHLLDFDGKVCCSGLPGKPPGPRQVVTPFAPLVDCDRCKDWGFGHGEHVLRKLPRNRLREDMGGGWVRVT